MPSIIWGVVSFSLGMLVFLLVPILAAGGSIETRLRVGRWFNDLAMKCFDSGLALVQRVFGGYDLLPMAINDDRKMAEVTVSSGIVSDSKKVPFRDPDERIKRLQGKPCCELLQDVPAAISPELAEKGYWLREHDGLVQTRACDQCGGTGRVDGARCAACDELGQITGVDPYVEMGDQMRVVSPKEVLAIPGCSVEPETIETAETLTEKRFSEYAGNIGAVEMGATFVSFAVGAGVVAGLQYLNTNVIESGGSTEPTSPVPLMLDVSTAAMDMAVMLL